MKIKLSNIIKIIIFSLLFFNMGGLKLITIKEYPIQAYTSIIGVILLFVCLFIKRIRISIIMYLSYINKYYIFCTFLLIIEGIYTLNRYEVASMNDVLIAGTRYIAQVIFAYPILYILHNIGIKKMTYIIRILFSIFLVLGCISVIIYNIYGILLFPGLSYDRISDNTIMVRSDGSMRIGEPFIGGFCFVSVVYYLLKNKSKTLLLECAFYFLYVLVISQTRAQLIYFTITALVMYMGTIKKNKVIKFTSLALVVGVVSIFVSGYVVDMFSVNSDEAYSTLARLYAINYYLDKWAENIFFGMGLIDVGLRNIDLYNIIHGPFGIASMNDLGVFAGLFASLGMIGIAIYLGLYFRFYKILKYSMINDCENKTLLLGLLVYFTLSSFTLSLFDSGRIFSLPFFIAIFEYCNVNNKNLKFKAALKNLYA